MSWLRRLFDRGRHDDVAREMAAHRAERVDDLIERGVAERDARRQAALEFGNPARYAEQSRAVWIAPWLEGLRQDARYALRALFRQPIFTLSAVLVLSIGIGLITALFLIIDSTVLRPWPVPDPSSIALIRGRPAPNQEFGNLSYPEYRYLREHTRTFANLAVNIRGGGPVGDGVTSRTVQTNFVSASYFDTLGVGMTIGRGFLASEDDGRRPAQVAIVSERLWRDLFGADRRIVGRTIRVYDHPVRVVGVAAAGFNDVSGSIGVDVWMPLALISLRSPSLALGFDDPKGSAGVVIGRLKAGVSRREGLAELDVLSRQFRRAAGLDAYGLLMTDTRPIAADRGLAGQLSIMGLLFAALTLVLLVACGNAGNLLLARALARRHEIAIRLSLGAGRARVMRQLLTESLFVSGAAAAIGLLIAAAFPRLMLTSRASGNGAAPSGFFAPDLAVFAFAACLAALSCVLCGLGPALHLTRVNLARAGDRHGATSSAHRLRHVLLAAQIALTMVLLTGAGLLTRAIGHAFTVDPGFAVDDVVKVAVRMPASTDSRMQAAVLEDVADRLAPASVRGVARADFAPFDEAGTVQLFRYTSDGEAGSRTMLTRGVSPEYFQVLGIPIVEGRTFIEDAPRSEVVVSESVARLFPAGRAIGQLLVTTSAPAPPRASVPADAPPPAPVQSLHEIVGIVKDVPVRSLDDRGRVLYWRPDAGATFLVRTTSTAAVPRIAAIVKTAAPGALTAVQTLRENMLSSLSNVVLGSRVAWTIGLVALTLAAIGAFGVFAYLVEERRREIGVRMALGARPRAVIRVVLGAASRPVLWGLAAGLVLSLAASPLLRSFLYGLSPFDPAAYLEIGGLLTAAALAATWIPAARATRVDPVTVLRND